MSLQRFIPNMQDVRDIFEGQGRQVTNLLLAINLATYIYTKYDRSIVGAMAAIPYAINSGEVHRLLTAGFLHTDFIHLLVNCLSIHWLGPGIESSCGRPRFALIYLSSVVAGSALLHATASFGTVAWGASGGVCGLFGAYLVYRLRNRNILGWDSSDMSWLAQVVGINLLLAAMSGGTTAHMAHLGGLLGGAASMWLIGPRYRWSNGYVVDRPIMWSKRD